MLKAGGTDVAQHRPPRRRTVLCLLHPLSCRPHTHSVLQRPAKADCGHQEPGAPRCALPAVLCNGYAPQEAGTPAAQQALGCAQLLPAWRPAQSPQDVYAFAMYVDQAAAHSKLHSKFSGQSAAALAKDQQLFDGEAAGQRGACCAALSCAWAGGLAQLLALMLTGARKVFPVLLLLCAPSAAAPSAPCSPAVPRNLQSWCAAMEWRRCCAL